MLQSEVSVQSWGRGWGDELAAVWGGEEIHLTDVERGGDKKERWEKVADLEGQLQCKIESAKVTPEKRWLWSSKREGEEGVA